MAHRAQWDDATSAAIKLLASAGYEACTVEELAAAVGISRSTFFRRFGSKEDVVFADHEYLLDLVTEQLERSTIDPLRALASAVEAVLAHHLRNPDLARVRFELLRANAPLRHRELVTSLRYERAFSAYLRSAVAVPQSHEWAMAAFPASLVAVHNRVLRLWLRDQSMAAAAQLRADLDHLLISFEPVLRPNPGGANRSRVVVSVYDVDASPTSVVDAIGALLKGDT